MRSLLGCWDRGRCGSLTGWNLPSEVTHWVPLRVYIVSTPLRGGGLPSEVPLLGLYSDDCMFKPLETLQVGNCSAPSKKQSDWVCPFHFSEVRHRSVLSKGSEGHRKVLGFDLEERLSFYAYACDCDNLKWFGYKDIIHFIRT